MSLDSLHVKTQHRRKGFGGRLLGAVVQWGKDQGATHLTGEFMPETSPYDEDNSAEMFYRKHNVKIDEDRMLHLRLE